MVSKIRYIDGNNYKKTKLYSVYCGMRSRCYSLKHTQFNDYGGRGITVCDEWLGKIGFSNFHSWSINNGFDEGLTIDRIDNNGNYEPCNCRWITRQEQNKNRSVNIYVTINNRRMIIADWCKALGLNVSTIYKRIDRSGWNVEAALLTPVVHREYSRTN